MVYNMHFIKARGSIFVVTHHSVLKETKMWVTQISIQRKYHATVRSYSNPVKSQ